MKNILVVFVSFLFCCSCSVDHGNESYGSNDVVSSEDEQTEFKEFLTVFKPYFMVDGNRKYLVTDSLLNVKIMLNDEQVGLFNSVALDTVSMAEASFSAGYGRDSVVKYQIIAPYLDEDKVNAVYTTAGEYAHMLANYFVLEPGMYLCEIRSFQYRDADGQLQTVRPNIVQPIELPKNAARLFLGEFDVQIN